MNKLLQLHSYFDEKEKRPIENKIREKMVNNRINGEKGWFEYFKKNVGRTCLIL